MGIEPTHGLFLKQPPLPIGLQEHIWYCWWELNPQPLVSKTSTSASWVTAACLVLLVGIEPTHRLFLRQPPLPIGLQEYEEGGFTEKFQQGNPRRLFTSQLSRQASNLESPLSKSGMLPDYTTGQ
jgi:hypothetical protein